MRFKTIKYKINKVALVLTAFSTCFGVLITILYLITKKIDIAILGFYHLFPTVIIHIILLLAVIINTMIHYEDRKEHFTIIILMLLNIPLAFGCFWIVEPFL